MIVRVTGILLAGGKSSRMGKDKGLMEFKGKFLAEYALDLLRSHCSEVLISSENSAYEQFSIPLVPDDYPDKGPMGGIYSAMKQSAHDWCLVLACDLPYINTKLIRALLAETVSGYSCIVPVHDELTEPLAALYHKRMLPDLKKALEENRPSLFRLIRSSPALCLDVNHLLDETPELFDNLNCPEDLITYG